MYEEDQQNAHKGSYLDIGQTKAQGREAAVFLGIAVGALVVMCGCSSPAVRTSPRALRGRASVDAFQAASAAEAMPMVFGQSSAVELAFVLQSAGWGPSTVFPFPAPGHRILKDKVVACFDSFPCTPQIEWLRRRVGSKGHLFVLVPYSQLPRSYMLSGKEPTGLTEPAFLVPYSDGGFDLPDYSIDLVVVDLRISRLAFPHAAARTLHASLGERGQVVIYQVGDTRGQDDEGFAEAVGAFIRGGFVQLGEGGLARSGIRIAVLEAVPARED